MTACLYRALLFSPQDFKVTTAKRIRAMCRHVQQARIRSPNCDWLKDLGIQGFSKVRKRPAAAAKAETRSCAAATKAAAAKAKVMMRPAARGQQDGQPLDDAEVEKGDEDGEVEEEEDQEEEGEEEEDEEEEEVEEEGEEEEGEGKGGTAPMKKPAAALSADDERQAPKIKRPAAAMTVSKKPAASPNKRPAASTAASKTQPWDDMFAGGPPQSMFSDSDAEPEADASAAALVTPVRTTRALLPQSHEAASNSAKRRWEVGWDSELRAAYRKSPQNPRRKLSKSVFAPPGREAHEPCRGVWTDGFESDLPITIAAYKDLIL